MTIIKKPKRTLDGITIFMIDILCFLFVFPLASCVVYKDASILTLMMLGFIIAVPIALIVGFVIIGFIWVILDSEQLPHMKNFLIESLLVGGIISGLFGAMVSALSLKFSLSMAITGIFVGLLIATTSQPVSHLKEEEEH